MTMVAAGLSCFMVSCTSPEHPKNETKRSVRAQTEVAQLTSIRDYFQAPGTVRAKTQTALASKVMGQITSVAVREGDAVRQGELLVEIEGQDTAAQLRKAQAGQAEANRSLEEAEGEIRASEAAVKTAQANQDLAQSTRKRFEMLRERHSVSPQEFDEVDSRYKAATSESERAKESLTTAQARRLEAVAHIEQAQAEVDAARVAVGYLKISSPITGIVTARQVEPGMLATPGMPLITIEDERTYQLHAVIEESRVGRIRTGEHVSVQIDGLEKPVDSRVREIVPASDPSSRTYTVKLDLVVPPEVRGRFHSGFFGRALVPKESRQALLVPESAIVQRGQLTGLYVVQNNQALFRLVKTGKRYDAGIEVLSGLNPGMRIVSKPDTDVAEGVTIIDPAISGVTP
jgi:multidrug efflux pump subunit AcrA (membrane-fusion protein)